MRAEKKNKKRRTNFKKGRIQNKTEKQNDKQQTLQSLQPTNWNPTHKCQELDKLCSNCGKKRHFARVCRQKENYKRKVQNVTEEETTATGGESYKSESSTCRIEKTNRITDRSNYLTAKVKVNGIEKEFIVDTGSPISIMPACENILKETETQKVKHRYYDVNKNEIKFRGQIPTDIENENNKQKTQILITERDDITPLLGMDLMKKFNIKQFTENLFRVQLYF